jgi:hypothetical protein
MDSWIIAKGILEAAAVIVGLFVAFAAVVWIGLGVTYVFAMLDLARERLWGIVVGLFRSSTSKTLTNEISVPPPVAAKTPEEIRLEGRRKRRTFLRKQYADQINSGKPE